MTIVSFSIGCLLLAIAFLVAKLPEQINDLLDAIAEHRRAQAASILSHSGLIQRIEDDE